MVDKAKDKPCVQCGKRKPLNEMELDHVRGKKLFPIGRCGYRPTEKVIAEIAKCDPRCTKCHRNRHVMHGAYWLNQFS